MINVLHPKYMLAPLIDKRNLITIILVSVFFGFYRLAGGKVYVPPPAPKFITKTTMEQLIKEDLSNLDSLSPSADIQKLSESKEVAQPESKVDRSSFLKGIFGTDNSKDQLEDDLAESKGTKNSKLTDIEKSLGLK